jgi:hypothetical protein
MPESLTRWTSFAVPADNYAFDAKLYNSLTAPNRNLSRLKEIETSTDAFLQLTYSATITNNTIVVIPWSSPAVSQNYPTMWNPLDNTRIYLDLPANAVGAWLIEVQISYAARTTLTRTFVRLTWFDGEAALDVYEDASESAQVVHQFLYPRIATGDITSFTVDIFQLSGANVAATATLRVRKLPSSVINYFPGYV